MNLKKFPVATTNKQKRIGWVLHPTALEEVVKQDAVMIEGLCEEEVEIIILALADLGYLEIDK